MAPAWMAELNEEWVEPPAEEQEEVNKLDFGSLVIDDRPLPSPSQASIDGSVSPVQFGTTVFHDAPPARQGEQHDASSNQEHSYQIGSILFSPSKKRTVSAHSPAASPSSLHAPSPGQQLAMAAAAFKKDLLHENEDNSSLDEVDLPASMQILPQRTPASGRLQSLFMQPSPASDTPDTKHRSSSVPIADKEEEQDQQGQETRYEEYQEDQEGSFIVNQQLDDIPEPSLNEESGSPSQGDVDIQHAGNSEPRELPGSPLCIQREALTPSVLCTGHVPTEDEPEVHLVHTEEPAPSEPVGQANTDIANETQSKTQSMILTHLPSTEFSFRVEPKSPPKLLSSYLEGVFTTPSQGEEELLHNSRGIATSTPSTSRVVNRHSSPSSPSCQVETPEAGKKQQSKLDKAKPSPALSIFKFQQDTYTRQHLQALVAEIDGLTSPPRANETPSYAQLDISDSQFGATGDLMLAVSRRGMYRQSDEYQAEANHPSTQTFEYSYHTAHVDQSPNQRNLLSEMDHPQEEEEDENGRIANTRSSKRVRLSASEYQPYRPQQHHYQNQSAQQQSMLSKSAVLSPFRTRIQNRVMPIRTQTPLRRRTTTQRAPFSAGSRLQYSHKADSSLIGNRTASPARPPLKSLPPLTAPVKRMYRSSILREQEPSEIPQETEEEEEEEENAPVETPPSRWRRTEASAPEEHGKTPAHVVQNRLQEAKAVMERIRQRNFQRQGSSSSAPHGPSMQTATAVLVPGSDRSPSIAITPDFESNTRASTEYLGDSNNKRRPITRQGTLSRPANPTPTTAAMAHSLRSNGRTIGGMAPTPEEEEETFNATSGGTARPEDQEGDVSAFDEKLDSLAPLPHISGVGLQHTAPTASVRRQLSTSPLVQQGSHVSYSSPAQAHVSSFASSSKHQLSTVPFNKAHNLQAPRYPAQSITSQTSSDRFFTSTSSRYVSGSTAPTSLVASSIGTAKMYHSEIRQGLVNITPAEAENLLTEDVLGDMVFDEEHKKWVKIDKYLASRANEGNNGNGLVSPAKFEGPALSPVEEMPGGDEENTADDPFRDLTSLESSRSRSKDLTGNSSGKGGSHVKTFHNRSGSLVLPLSASQANSSRGMEDDRQTEKTSTPPHVSVAPPFISPDVPSISEVSSSAQATNSRSASMEPQHQQQLSTSTSSHSEARNLGRRTSSGNPMPPKSVLKRSDTNAFSTPLPSSKLISRINSKQTRSVSFSDGKIPGRGDSLDAQQARVASSALRNEIKHSQISDHDSASEDEQERQREERPEPEEEDDTISLNAYTSTITKRADNQSQHQQPSRNDAGRQMEHDTPTALYHSYTRPRSLRLKPRGPASLANSMVSTASTLAWHRKPLNANATILTECSFGVSYDRLLRVLTDVVPFEPSWKDLDHINLRERGLESVVRLKEFLPNLDELNLSDNNIAYLTGLPSSLRFLSLTNNRLGDLSSFTYLKNLETLNISGNTGVTSVRQLGCLQHLRSLKADGCGIDSIEGIDQLDGLVTLSLCNNSINQLRLENTAWIRLETLDASDNNITEVTGLETLPLLRSLNLGRSSLPWVLCSDHMLIFFRNM